MLLKKLVRCWKKNRLESHLYEAYKRKARRIVTVWNRGLGDIPLGLYAFVVRARQYLPDVALCVVTREDLLPLFALLPDVEARALPDMVRGVDANPTVPLQQGDYYIASIDPTRDLAWQLDFLQPRLNAALLPPPSITEGAIGLHVDSETGSYYGYEKNWPRAHWQALIDALVMRGERVVLFGKERGEPFVGETIIDLRGQTTLYEMLSLASQACRILVAPDSGILSTVYYLDAQTPVTLISLWADPRQGVLRQKVPSPNNALEHLPLIAPKGDLSQLSPQRVISCIEQCGASEGVSR